MFPKKKDLWNLQQTKEKGLKSFIELIKRLQLLKSFLALPKRLYPYILKSFKNIYDIEQNELLIVLLII